MKNLTVKEILEATNGKLIIGNEQLVCDKFSRDTRNIEKGDTYIALKGATFNGNLFWREALDSGAKCVVIEEIDFREEDNKKYEGKTIIKVENTLKALHEIARYKRSLYDIPVIAITGSVGKTSTKDIIANVVSQKYKTLKTIGNKNNDIGLPFTILGLQDEEAMVLEMGMNHMGEISLLTSIAKPNICVITNIGTSHIGNLGSRENILKAKMEILEGNENPTVIINNDNDLLHKWYEKNKDEYNILTYGINEKSNLKANYIKLETQKSEYMCEVDNNNIKVKVPVGGEHFILNSLSAIAVGKALEIETDKIINGIASFELTKNRMDIIDLENEIKIINDAYNASLESMRAALKVLAGFDGNRKIAVLGDMFELGDFAEEMHKEVGKEVYKNKIDILICSGKNSRSIVEQAKKEGLAEENIYYIENKDEIIDVLKDITKSKDIILFKASNGMRFYELAEKFIKEK